MSTIELGRAYRAALNPDDWILRMVYLDSTGRRTLRYVSPTRVFRDKGYLRGLCLAREEVRTFSLDRITDVVLVAAHRVQMPVPMIELPATSGVAVPVADAAALAGVPAAVC